MSAVSTSHVQALAEENATLRAEVARLTRLLGSSQQEADELRKLADARAVRFEVGFSCCDVPRPLLGELRAEVEKQ